ncbi:hypothetical protein [Micromonospora palomenae]|uniref:hypothetical protein n=1 Tax=Micromonospora palomenae TaxID=1461247 RepID=UPI003F8CB633
MTDFDTRPSRSPVDGTGVPLFHLCFTSTTGRAVWASCRGEARPQSGPWGGTMPELVRKLLFWGFIAFLIFFMAFRPDGAAQMFKGIGAGLMAIFQGLGDFMTSLMT